MIITKGIPKLITKYNIKKLSKYGIIGDKILMPISELSISSHKIIFVSCDVCLKESYKPYRQYMISFNNGLIYCCSPTCSQAKNKKTNLIKYGVENVFMCKDVKEKIVKTNNEKYGVDYPSQSVEIREKVIETSILKYGVDNPSKNKAVKEKMVETSISKYGVEYYASSTIAKEVRISNGLQVSDELRSEFYLYQRKVRKLTDRVRKELYDNWDGYDYYDHEYIKDNLNYQPHDKNYRS